MWAPLRVSVAGACPIRARAGIYSLPPLLLASLLRSHRFPPRELLLFFPRERLKTGGGVASPLRATSSPYDNWESWSRALLPLPKGKTRAFVGGCSDRSAQHLADASALLRRSSGAAIEAFSPLSERHVGERGRCFERND